jgi:hypothetical protein
MTVDNAQNIHIANIKTEKTLENEFFSNANCNPDLESVDLSFAILTSLSAILMPSCRNIHAIKATIAYNKIIGTTLNHKTLVALCSAMAALKFGMLVNFAIS